MRASSGAIEYHAGLAGDWERKYTARRSFRARGRRIASLIEGVVEPGARWLDAGCGSGHFSRQLASLGAHVSAVDGAEDMIAAARGLGAGAPGDVVYRTSGDLAHLPEPDGAFDGVLCSSVLEYLAEPEQALAEFARVTRGGGTLVVTLPNARALIRRVHALQFAVTKSVGREPAPAYWAHMKHMWTLAQAGSFVRAAGFEPSSIRAGGLGLGPAWLDEQTFWGPLLFVCAVRR